MKVGRVRQEESESWVTHCNDLTRHNAWATVQVLKYCQGINESDLNATVPGTYGTIIQILRHTIDSESSYLFRISGAWDEFPWARDEEVCLETLGQRAAVLAATWEQFLSNDIDTEQLDEAKGDDGDVFAVRGSIFITQALHHANEHRAQVCSILGALGHEPPDVSAWGYALASGRSWLTSPSSLL